MQKKDELLAEFQAILLDTLSKYNNASEILEILNNNTSCKYFRTWISQIDPSMLEVGAELVKKWGQKE